jgi:homocitrate synthase
MCPTCASTEDAPINGNNGTNGVNGNHDGYTSVNTRQNPHPTHKSPYQPVGDFLSNVSRFKIIGTLYQFFKRDRMRTRGLEFCY